MEINRNQYFMIGLVLLFIGIQFRVVDSFILNENTTRFLAERTQTAAASTTVRWLPAAGPPAQRTIQPPEWLGYSLMSIGSVLILHSLAMRRPDSK